VNQHYAKPAIVRSLIALIVLWPMSLSAAAKTTVTTQPPPTSKAATNKAAAGKVRTPKPHRNKKVHRLGPEKNKFEFQEE
jgi:hypothetical protein